MKPLRCVVQTHEDVEEDRPGRTVVVGLAEYVQWARTSGKPAGEIFSQGADLETWAMVVHARLRRADPENTPEDLDQWMDGIASALPEMFITAMGRISIDEEVETAVTAALEEEGLTTPGTAPDGPESPEPAPAAPDMPTDPGPAPLVDSGAAPMAPGEMTEPDPTPAASGPSTTPPSG